MKKLKVLVLFDYPMEPPDEDYAAHIPTDDWKTEKAVFSALKKLGHEAKPFPIFNRISPLVAELRRHPPDILVNLADSFNNRREHDADLAGLFELCGVHYTGCPPVALTMCRNKAFAKRILAPHRIKVPRSLIFPRGKKGPSLKNFRFPAFVKPLGQEGSDGISRDSFCPDEAHCLDRVKFLHESLKTDAMVDEYIEGREIYAGVLGNDRLTTLPLREMVFTKEPEKKPHFATFKSKWDEEYRKKWGIKNRFPTDLSENLVQKINRISRKAYRALGLSGYGRLDIRLTPENDVYVIEVNPNPSLAPDDEIALAAQKAGLDYAALIQKLLSLGMTNETRV